MEKKFRIKSDYGNKEWIYFELPWCYSESFSCDLSEIKDKTTLGQFVCMKDMNGKDVYEGDIIKYIRLSTMMDRFITYTDEVPPLTDHNFYDVIKFHAKEIQIVGNVFDNPELLIKK